MKLPLSVLSRLSVCLCIFQAVCLFIFRRYFTKADSGKRDFGQIEHNFFKKTKYFRNDEIYEKLGISQTSFINGITNPMIYKIFLHALWHKPLFSAIKLQDSSEANISKISWMERLNVCVKIDILRYKNSVYLFEATKVSYIWIKFKGSRNIFSLCMCHLISFLKMQSLNFEGREKYYNLLKFIFILFVGLQLNLQP